MVINEINIINFGNISNKKIEFTDGFNVLCGENEAGKSTILSFVRFVLYGFCGRKSDLKKYEPLSGEKINGSITVTNNGTTYEISRNLNLTKSKQVSAVNKTTGEVMDKDFCASVGENILNINDASFINTLFIGQSSSHLGADKQELLTKLSNISQSGDEDISYGKILSEIDDQILSITSPRRKDSVLPKLENEISELNSKIFMAKRELEVKEIKQKELEDIKIKLENKEKELAEYKKQSEISKILTLKKREKEENNNIIRLKADIESAKGELEKIEINEKFLKIDENEELEFLKEENLDFSEKFTKLTKNVKTLFILSLICGIIGIASGIAFLIFMPPLSLLGLVFVASSVTLGVFALKNKAQKNNLEKQNDALLLKKKEYLLKYGVESKEEYLNEKSKCEKALKEKEILEEKIKLKNENLEFSVKMHNQAKEDILTNYENIDTIKVSDYEKYKNIGEINANIVRCENEIKIILQNMHRLEFETELKNENDIISLMQKLDEAKNKQKEAKDSLEVYETFKKYLMLSFDELKSNFAPQLANESSRIFNKLTNANYTDVLINDEFDAKIKIGSSYEESHYLSGATIDQLYFSVRLGIINTIGKSCYPVILDDAFAFYDEKRLKTVLDFLLDYSKTNQIIVASCHRREADYLEGKANIINL